MRAVPPILAALACAAIALTPASAAAQGGTAYASGANASKCMDVAGGNLAEGTAVILYQCQGSANQKFILQSDGHLVVMNGATNAQGRQMCVDYHPYAGNNGDPVTIWPCRQLWGARDNQHWSRNAQGQFVAGSGRCIDIRGGASQASHDAVPLVLWDCPDPGHYGTRTWNPVGQVQTVASQPAPPPAARPAPPAPAISYDMAIVTDANRCLVPRWGSVVVGSCQGAARYAIRDGRVMLADGRCFDSAGNQRGPIVLRRCNGSKSQQWYFVPNKLVQNLGNGALCLDLQGEHQTDGTIVQAWDCKDYRNPPAHQRFYPGGTFSVITPSLPQVVRDDLARGAGFVVFSNGSRVIAAGGGNVIAAGGGNVIAAGGGNVIAPGGGNVIAPGGGNVIAPGGGNLISVNAAGLGNLFSGASVIAAGGGN